MLLDDLLGAVDVRALHGGRPGVVIADIRHDTREVTPGTLYVCVPGARADGHDLAGAAVAAGAAALVVERPIDGLDVPQAVVADSRAAMGPLADRFFGEPTAGLAVLGVTGTNGKTTTAFLVRSILEAAGRQCGLLGTVQQMVGGVIEPVERTTPEAISLQRTFRRMVDAGDRACAIEVSSHALALHRVDGVRFAAAAFTNLSQDHLDFHADLDEYFATKARLFDGRCPTAANADDPYGRRLDVTLRFGIDAGDVRARDIAIGPHGTRFVLESPIGHVPVELRLRGGFNVSNALAAAALALLVDVPLDRIAAGLAALTGVPGRMEPVDRGQAFAVIVDYAHTPDALETVLAAARGFCTGRLRVVFGCGGDRDRGKRPQMGAVAAGLADVAIVTSDNPRSEDPDAIIAEVVSGMPAGATVEPDRRAAIGRAIAEAEAGDVVVIAGKGHEQGQERDGVTAPFDDRVVALEALARRG